MAFIETPRFPDDIAQGATGGPGYSTTINAQAGGHEQRNQNWARDRGSWECSTAVRTPEDFVAVRDMFRMARGRAHGFRFRDWADWFAEHDEGTLTLVAGSLWQMFKRYGSGAQVEYRLITKPVAGTVQVQRTRAAVITTITPTIDATTGGVTIAGHVGGDTYTWAGEFDVPVRFDVDQLRQLQIGPTTSTRGPLLVWESVPLVELRAAGAVAP